LVADVAVAPARVSMSVGPVSGSGLATTDQLVPVRCSVRVRAAAPSDTSPTAQASPGRLAAAYRKLSSLGGPALGLATSCQLPLSRCKIMGRYAAPGLK